MIEWGFPPPEQQIVIFDDNGDVIARLDAGWSVQRIGLEYDLIRWHGPLRWASDEDRRAKIEALGWVIRSVDKAVLVPGSRELPQLIRALWDRNLPR